MKITRLPRLDSPRLYLRRPLPSDARGLYEIFRDPEVNRFWSETPLRRVAQARAVIDSMRSGIRNDDIYEWMLIRKADGQLVGTCALGNLSLENQRGEIGYALGRPYWGQGYMQEILPELVRWAFGDLGLRRLEADVDPRNAASLRLLRRLGFKREGLLRERWAVTGEIQDSLLLGLLEREWRARRRKRSG